MAASSSHSGEAPLYSYIWDHLPPCGLPKPPLAQSQEGCGFASVARQGEYQKIITLALHGPPPNISFNHFAWEAKVRNAYPDRVAGFKPYDLMILCLNEQRKEMEEEVTKRAIRHAAERNECVLRDERLGMIVDNSGLTHWFDHVRTYDKHPDFTKHITDLLEVFKTPVVATIPILKHYPNYAQHAYQYNSEMGYTEQQLLNPDIAHSVVLVGVHRPTPDNNPHGVDTTRPQFVYENSFPQWWFEGNWSEQPEYRPSLGNGLNVIDAELIIRICYSVSCSDVALMQKTEREYEAQGNMAYNDFTFARRNATELRGERLRGLQRDLPGARLRGRGLQRDFPGARPTDRNVRGKRH